MLMMNVRVQTWFPYPIQIALNGREWLRRRLEARGVDWLRPGNNFLHIEHYTLGQQVLRRQLDRQWPRLLNSFLPIGFPTISQAISDACFTVSGITNAAPREKLRGTSWGAGRTDKQLSARITWLV